MMLMMMVHLLVKNNSSKEILLHTLSHGGEEEEKFVPLLKNDWQPNRISLDAVLLMIHPRVGARASSDE